MLRLGVMSRRDPPGAGACRFPSPGQPSASVSARAAAVSGFLLASCLMASAPGGAHAAAASADASPFPQRPLRIVVGFTPGGQPDITARLVGARLAEFLRQQVVIDNRPGAGGVIGTRIVAEATPDGHTLLSVSASHVISPALRAKLPYDTLKDFAGISTTASSCYVLVVAPTSPVRSAQDLIALARAKPGQLTFGSAGTGSGTHFAGELLRQNAGIDVVHVPYKGIPEALTDTITGRVQYFLAPIGSAAQIIRDGKLRPLGVTSLARAEILPDVPALAEAGFPGFRWDAWAGLLLPARTPRALVEKLNAEVVRALGEPGVQQRLRAIGLEPLPSTPAQFDKLLAEQYAMVAGLAKKAGIQPQ